MERSFIKSTRVIFENEIKPATLEIINGVFVNIYDYHYICTPVTNYGDHYIAPGLIDIHTHGLLGIGFDGSLDKTSVPLIPYYYASVGVTNQLVSCSFKGAQIIKEGLLNHPSLNRSILGIHLEGPFLNPLQHGAASPDTRFPLPNVDRIKEINDSLKPHLIMMTIAPEIDGSNEVIDYLNTHQIITSVGHCQADFDLLNKMYLNKQFKSLTHLGNAMKGIHHRELGTFGFGLYNDDVYTEIIADGIHLSKEMLQFIYKIKNKDRILFISDSIGLAGLSKGVYQLNNQTLTINDQGMIVNAYGHINGSSFSILHNIQYNHQHLWMPLVDLFKFASLNPAKFLNMDHHLGSIEIHKEANYIILTPQLDLLKTFLHHQCIYDKDVSLKPINLKKVILDPLFLSFYE